MLASMISFGICKPFLILMFKSLYLVLLIDSVMSLMIEVSVTAGFLFVCYKLLNHAIENIKSNGVGDARVDFKAFSN
jgi:hypothetical protein